MLFKGPQFPFFHSQLGALVWMWFVPPKVPVKEAWSPVWQGGGALKVGAQGRSSGHRHLTLMRAFILAS